VVLTSTKYATISVPIDIKNRLEKAKGKKEWGEFIISLYTETQKLRSEKAFTELTEILTQEDLKAMTESSKEFKESFAFR
jgi:hypothetical protein